MRPRERAIRGQLRMIADICRENGVACLMTGDVENRAQAEQLITEFGVDGAMIATAAETNSSCFRSEADGGLAPWNEVVEQYIKTALEVENRFGNTKYLLNHLIPGKQPVYREIATSRSYHQVCQMLGLEHLESQAKEIDEKLGITPETQALQGGRGERNKSAMAAGGNQSKIRSIEAEKKKGLSERGIKERTLTAVNA
jgi:tRNA-dihydrouridine synthase 2